MFSTPRANGQHGRSTFQNEGIYVLTIKRSDGQRHLAVARRGTISRSKGAWWARLDQSFKLLDMIFRYQVVSTARIHQPLLEYPESFELSVLPDCCSNLMLDPLVLELLDRYADRHLWMARDNCCFPYLYGGSCVGAWMTLSPEEPPAASSAIDS